jgi:hypothetical protein
MSSGTISILEVRSNSIPINSQIFLTELICPHYTETYKLRIQNLILKSIEILGSLKHAILVVLVILFSAKKIKAQANLRRLRMDRRRLASVIYVDRVNHCRLSGLTG